MASYNVNPSPGGGSGVFGSVPGPISLPQPYQDFGQVLPGTQSLQTGGASDVLSELEGQLSPETLASIQNQGAGWGVMSGMPGSGVQRNHNLYQAAMTSMQQQQTGAKNYGGLVGPSSRYLTVAPSTEAEIAETNALNAAAPNPTLSGLTNIASMIGGMGFNYALNNFKQGGTSYQYEGPSDTTGYNEEGMVNPNMLQVSGGVETMPGGFTADDLGNFVENFDPNQ
jgi:hypothetical protein